MHQSRILRFKVAARVDANMPAGRNPPVTSSTSRRPASQFSYAPSNNGAYAEEGHKKEAERRQGLDQAPRGPRGGGLEPTRSKGLFTMLKDGRGASYEYTHARNAADFLTPNTDSSYRKGSPKGMDESCMPASAPTPEERRARLREGLEANAHSHVSFVGEEGAMDFDLNKEEQKPQLHDDGLEISRQSSMYQTMFKKGALDSRRASTTWSLLDREHSSDKDLDDMRLNNTSHDRQWREHEGVYHKDFDDPVLEHAYESVDHSTSIYTHRKMFMDGLFGVERFLSKSEEKLICEEVMKLTQQPAAAYIAEEARYCVNLYERTLGVPGMDPLAFSLDQHAPTLHGVLVRAFDVGLIPALPNVCQCSEFVGGFSGYPMHQKHASLGPYVGVMSLVSDSVMHLSHISQPWGPKVYVRPRSIYVMQQPCLGEYKVGFRKPHKPFHDFRFATRQSKDYRIEILFACVDTKQVAALRDAVHITDCAASKLLPKKDPVEAEAAMARRVSATMAEQLRGAMNTMGKKTSTSVDSSSGTAFYESSIKSGRNQVKAVDGAALQRQSMDGGLMAPKGREAHVDTKVLVEAMKAREKQHEQFQQGRGMPTRAPRTLSSAVIPGKYTSTLPDWDS